jgi:hypothetical protein
MGLKIIIGSLILAAAPLALADEHEPVKLNFNQMIDETHHDNAALSEDLATHFTEPKDEKEKDKDKDVKVEEASIDEQKVHDFVTFEVIQMKKDQVAERPNVKRTYNSVEEPRVAVMPEVELVKAVKSAEKSPLN